MRRMVQAIPAALALVGCLACARTSEEGSVTPPTPPVDAQRASQAGPADAGAGSWVVLKPAGQPEARVRVRLARTPMQRRRGLMYVRSLPPDEGMLFLFEEDEVQGFWMKNTLIPLDMIFIDKDLAVVGVVENAEPLSLETRGVGEPSRYVLEVNGGWARKHGVEAGTKVEFQGI